MPQGIGCLDEVDSYNNHIRVFDQKAGGMILDCNNGLCGGASWPKCKLVYETKSGWRSLMRWINILCDYHLLHKSYENWGNEDWSVVSRLCLCRHF